MLRDFFKGHFFLFDKIEYRLEREVYGKLIITFLLIQFLFIPGIQQLSIILSLSEFIWGNLLVVLLMFSVFFLLIRLLLSSDFLILRLHPWKDWPIVQKLYLIQVAPIALVIFIVLFNKHIKDLLAGYGNISTLILFSAIPGLLWGMLQEFVYRGLLQNVLVGKFNVIVGILISNLLFTFGPLHFNYFNMGTDNSVEWSMFGSILLIGLLFGIIYQRSGNLWIPAILHGVWVLNWQ